VAEIAEAADRLGRTVPALSGASAEIGEGRPVDDESWDMIWRRRLILADLGRGYAAILDDLRTTAKDRDHRTATRSSPGSRRSW